MRFANLVLGALFPKFRVTAHVAAMSADGFSALSFDLLELVLNDTEDSPHSTDASLLVLSAFSLGASLFESSFSSFHGAVLDAIDKLSGALLFHETFVLVLRLLSLSLVAVVSGGHYPFLESAGSLNGVGGCGGIDCDSGSKHS